MNKLLKYCQTGGIAKDNTSVSKKYINPLEKQRINNDYLKSLVDKNKTYLNPQSNVSQNVKDIAIRQQSDDKINSRQDKANMLGLALAPVPVLGEIYNTGNIVAQGTVDALQGEYGNAAMSAVPFGISKIKTVPGVLNNAYKLNPFAKGNTLNKFDKNSFLRQVDEETYQEGLKSGLIKGKQNIPTGEKGSINLSKSFGDDAYYNKGSLYSPQRADYVYDVKKGEEFFIPKVNGKIKSGKTIYSPENTTIRVSKNPIPFNDADVYKKHWLKGYEKQNKLTNSFKSKIDWSKWNNEIPQNKKLLDEYNNIEKLTKSNGSWMKNSNGSKFEGTPEQFIQQNSINFKEAFPNPLKTFDGKIQKNYHGSPNTFEVFDEAKFANGVYGKGIYTTPNKDIAKIYMGKEKDKSKLFELYQNANNKKQILDITKNNKIAKGEDFMKIADTQVVPFTNYPKSAIGNNGMFDMTNPNIYKSIAPVVGSGIVANQYRKKQTGGKSNLVNAEKGEVYKDENNNIRQVNQNAPTHDDGILIDDSNPNNIKSASYNNGGVILNDAQSVLSATHENRDKDDKSYGLMDEAIKIKPKELKDYATELGLKLKNNKSVSPSKGFELLRDAKIKHADVLLNKNKTNEYSDMFSKNSIKSNITQANTLIQDEELYDMMFDTQELKKLNLRKNGKLSI